MLLLQSTRPSAVYTVKITATDITSHDLQKNYLALGCYSISYLK
ncbi:hypothetical protein ATE84_3178 [Aquimarina sp. MAR_2010_214]|nr:hypothetical protein ATE84_3178 [Aquimarina sp. MAR_2010_214]